MSKYKKMNLIKLKRTLSLFLVAVLTICGMPLCAQASEPDNGESSIIVSLGDSYSSGEGIEPFYGQSNSNSVKVNNPDWLAHRSENSWPGMLTLPAVSGTMSQNRNTNWFFTAVSGAVTDNLLNEQKKEYNKGKYEGSKNLSPQLSIFDNLSDGATDYVTLTLGGNDADFAGIITDVVVGSTYLNLSGLSDKLNETWKKFYEDGGIADDLQSSYKEIANRAGEQAHIIVAGYPKLLDPNGKGFFVSKEEATLVNTAVSNFNNAIEHIVNQCSNSGMKISFVSVENAFDGHGAYSENPYINEVIFGTKSQDLKDIDITSAYSIHPNYEGAKAYARCVQAELNKLEGIAPVTCSTDIKVSTLGYYGELYGNYTMTIEGKENIALWGLISKKYYDEIAVDEAKIVRLNLPEGTYEITVSDGKSSYFKNIKIRENSDNDVLIINTNFGYISEQENTEIGGQYDRTKIPSDAVEFNGHWYKIIQDDTVSSWSIAQQYCSANNGYLATITSQEENDFLYAYMKQEGYSSAYFGFSDSSSEGTWSWCNGEQSAYTNWHSSEPNGENSNEDYALFYYKYSDGTWNDGDFGNRTANSGTAFICEWGEYEIAPQITEPVRTTSDERDIVLVLDVSGSMSGTPMEETKKASVNFVDTILDEDASIGIVTYDNSASRLSDFSVNQDALISAVSSIWDGGGTNIEAGLAEAHSMLSTSNAKKKIIVLMSDGEPNDGKEGDDLIAYADEIKSDDIIIYTLGFFESLGSYKSSAQMLMEGIASDGCHYEVANADDLVFFFEDMADQINGQKYIYIRIACPVDVSVTYNGETLTSAEDELTTRTDFGTLTFEENENVTDADEDDRIKVLRLKEGADYDVEIVGTGHGIMDYTIGFMDENGDYSDFRRFEDIKITRRTKIDTVATVSKDSVLNIDEDGDGRYDLKLRADENGYGEEVDDSMMMYVVMGGGALLLLLIVVCVARKRKKKKLKENN